MASWIVWIGCTYFKSKVKRLIFPGQNCQYYCESLFEWQLTSCLLPGPVHFDIQPFESVVWLELKFPFIFAMLSLKIGKRYSCLGKAMIWHSCWFCLLWLWWKFLFVVYLHTKQKENSLNSYTYLNHKNKNWNICEIIVFPKQGINMASSFK